jgi:hypothetical protein
MALRYLVSGGDGIWNSTSNWSETSGGSSGASIPTSADDVIIDLNSNNANISVTTAQSCLSFSASDYSGTLTLNANLTIGGSSTFDSGMIIVGSNTIIMTTGGTITTNGIIFPRLTFSNTTTTPFTLADDLNIQNLTIGNTQTINGNSFNISGDLFLSNTLLGTSNINLIGTGTWNTTGTNRTISSTLTINTSGTITIGTVGFSGTLNYISGTVISTGTLTINACTMNCADILWHSVTTATTASVCTLLQNLNVAGTFTCAVFYNFNTSNGSTLNLQGNFINNSGNLGGNATIRLIGTGNIGGGGQITSNVIIDTIGTYTLTANITYQTGTFTHISGTVVSTGFTFICTNSCTLNLQNIVLANFRPSAIITLLSDLNAINVSVTSSSTINNFTLYVTGNFSYTAGVGGTTHIMMTGTGNLSIGVSNFTIALSNNLTINTQGTINILNLNYSTRTFRYIAGTVTHVGILAITGNATLDIGPIILDQFTTTVTLTLTLLANLTMTGTFSQLTGTLALSGLFNIYVGGGLSQAGTPTISGNSTIIMNGTGTISSVSAGSGITSPLIIETAGTITYAPQTTHKKGGVFTYISGTVINADATIAFSSIVLNTPGISWDNVIISTGTNTFNTYLNVNNTLTVGTLGNVSFVGEGFTTQNFVSNTAGRAITFRENVTYVINDSITINGGFASKISLVSSSSTIKSKVIFNGNNQDVINCITTRIDFSTGTTIWSFRGSITDSLNINPLRPIENTSSTFLI